MAKNLFIQPNVLTQFEVILVFDKKDKKKKKKKKKKNANAMARLFEINRYFLISVADSLSDVIKRRIHM